jgi:hypothetical protein
LWGWPFAICRLMIFRVVILEVIFNYIASICVRPIVFVGFHVVEQVNTSVEAVDFDVEFLHI